MYPNGTLLAVSSCWRLMHTNMNYLLETLSDPPAWLGIILSILWAGIGIAFLCGLVYIRHLLF